MNLLSYAKYLISGIIISLNIKSSYIPFQLDEVVLPYAFEKLE